MRNVSSAPDTSVVVPHQHVIKLCNPSASLLRLNGGLGRPIATTREVVDDVLTSTGYSLPSAVAHRNVTCPGWHAAHKSAAFRKAARGSVAGEMAAMDAAAVARAQWRACEAQIDGVCPLPDNVCAFRGRNARTCRHTHAHTCPATASVLVNLPVVYHKRRLKAVLSRVVRLQNDPVSLLRTPLLAHTHSPQ